MLHSTGSVLRKSSDVHLIYNKILRRRKKLLAVAPVKVIPYHPGMINIISRCSPFCLTGNCPGIRIKKDLLLIKYQSFCGIMRPVHSVSILNVLYIKVEYYHGIDISYLIIIRKRDDPERLLFF